MTRHKRCGCQPCREVEAVVQRLGVTQCRGPGIQTIQSGRRPDVDPGLRSWATCVLAAPGSGSRLGRLDESDRKTRLCGHKRCGCQRCREAGSCVPFSRQLSVPERQPSVPKNHAPILGDVCASRTRTRSNLCRLRYFDRRTRVSLYGLRGSGFLSPSAPVMRDGCTSRAGVRVPPWAARRK